LKITFANILKLLIDAFADILKQENKGLGLDNRSPHEIARRISANMKIYLISRMMCFLLYDIQLEMQKHRLPGKNELSNLIFGNTASPEDKDKFDKCFRVANEMHTRFNKDQIIQSILDRIIKQLYDACAILQITALIGDEDAGTKSRDKIDSLKLNSESKSDLDRLNRLYLQCLVIYEGGDVADRDALGKLTRIQKLIADEFSASCHMVEQPELKSSSPLLTRTSSNSSKKSKRGGSSIEKRSSIGGRSGSMGKIQIRLSFKKSESLPNLIQLTSKEMNTKVELINSNPDKFHNARLLGLILGDIYRDDNAPKLRDKDMQEPLNQAALMIEMPNPAAVPNISERYTKLPFAVKPQSKNRGFGPRK